MNSGSSFAGAALQNSKVNNGCIILNLDNSEAVEITTKYDDDGRIMSQEVHRKRPARQSAIKFANPPNETLLAPKCISRLITTRDAFGSTIRRSTGSVSIIQSQRTTNVALFMMVAETQESLLRKLQIQSKTIRNHMRSNFFFGTTEVIPLWNPAPASVTYHPKFIETNLCVGDVGFFTNDGGFEVQFNIFLSFAKNAELGFDPPDGFQEYGNVSFSYEVSDTTFVSPDKHIELPTGNFEPSGSLRGRCVASYRLSRSWFERRAAGNILYLPNGYWSDQMRVHTINGIANHISRHAQSWYDYYDNKLDGPSIPKGHSLEIITMSYKCDAWAIAACSTASKGDIFARLNKKSDDPILYEWDNHHKVRCNTGTAPFPNQCVAVRVHSIETSAGPVQKMVSKLSHLSGCSLSNR